MRPFISMAILTSAAASRLAGNCTPVLPSLGCFDDTKGPHAVSASFGTVSSVAQCSFACGLAGFRLAGLTGNAGPPAVAYCYCGASVDPAAAPAPATDCSLPCPGGGGGGGGSACTAHNRHLLTLALTLASTNPQFKHGARNHERGRRRLALRRHKVRYHLPCRCRPRRELQRERLARHGRGRRD